MASDEAFPRGLKIRCEPPLPDCGRYLSLALQIIHATGGDPKRADEAAHIIAAHFETHPRLPC